MHEISKIRQQNQKGQSGFISGAASFNAHKQNEGDSPDL